MDYLVKELIEKLNKEEDTIILEEVLNFYEYLNYKKNAGIKDKLLEIEENEQIKDEDRLYHQY